MEGERTAATDALFAQGMAQFQSGQWEDAVKTFSELRDISNAYPEVDALIGDALLKAEVERARSPESVAPPKHRPFLRPRLLTAVPTLFIIGAILLFVLRPFSGTEVSVATAPTASGSLPTPAPTNTPTPTNTPLPTSTPLPTNTPEPTLIQPPGVLQVRMADGQPLVRTIGNIEIILDASGSMGGQIDGRRKIDIAHESLAALVGELPESTNVALRSYGHRKGSDCGDVELISPIGPLDRVTLIERINSINPAQNGMTPIAASLQQITEDLKNAQGDVLVVLVSDGDETCNGDPAQVAAQIHAGDPRIKISVIGFNVGPEDWRARLTGIAQGGGGSYFDAADATQLVAALQQAVALTFRVLDQQGAEVFSGALGSETTLPAGSYRVEINGETPLTIGDITVGGTTPAIVELREQDGKLVGEVKR
jgi:Ca-activated chloride channel family protein